MTQLTYTGGGAVRLVPDPVQLLAAFVHTDPGAAYLDHRPITPPNTLVPEDLAVTLVVNSRADGRPFISLMQRGSSFDLASVPETPLADSSDQVRAAAVDRIADLASWSGFGASLATKVLHKKRPALIPILDNQAIFGAYLNPAWPAARSLTETVKSRDRIAAALEQIRTDLVRPDNAEAWRELRDHAPRWTQIEIWDAVWWMYFREKEPVRLSR